VDVYIPDQLEEALEIKRGRPDCVPIAGGTDLMVELNFGRRRPSAVMDISRVAGLKEVRADDDAIFVGAGVTFTTLIEQFSFMAAVAGASRTVGSPQIRNRGTIGGNLATASPAGDALPVLACLDAEVILGRKGGTRSVPWHSFLTGPKRNALGPDELILGVRWRPTSGPSVFSKIGTRNAMVIAVSSLCIVFDDARRSVRIAAGSVAPTVIRLPAAEAATREMLDAAGAWDDCDAVLDETRLAEIRALVEAGVSPIDDFRATAAYRKHTCGVLVYRTLRWALEERSAGSSA
jgi:CO/xanthine dehydrogenase FAD-binding subunit